MRNIYQLNFLNYERYDRASSWSRLWKMKLHERLKVFLSRIMVGALSSRDLVCAKTGGAKKSCGICGEEE